MFPLKKGDGAQRQGVGGPEVQVASLLNPIPISELQVQNSCRVFVAIGQSVKKRGYMTQYSAGPYMKMSPTGLPGLLVVLFVVFTTCAFFGVDFLWVLLGLGALGVGLAAVLRSVYSRLPKDVDLSLVSHGADRRGSSRK
jgi:hypothetical protein